MAHSAHCWCTRVCDPPQHDTCSSASCPAVREHSLDVLDCCRVYQRLHSKLPELLSFCHPPLSGSVRPVTLWPFGHLVGVDLPSLAHCQWCVWALQTPQPADTQAAQASNGKFTCKGFVVVQPLQPHSSSEEMIPITMQHMQHSVQAEGLQFDSSGLVWRPNVLTTAHKTGHHTRYQVPGHSSAFHSESHPRHTSIALL